MRPRSTRRASERQRGSAGEAAAAAPLLPGFPVQIAIGTTLCVCPEWRRRRRAEGQSTMAMEDGAAPNETGEKGERMYST